jgi:hypothetical protein
MPENRKSHKNFIVKLFFEILLFFSKLGKIAQISANSIAGTRVSVPG